MRLRARRRKALWCRVIARAGRPAGAGGAALPRAGTTEVTGWRRSLVRLCARRRPGKHRSMPPWSWFGFQVGLGVAGAGLPGFQEFDEGPRLVSSLAAGMGEDDHASRGARQPVAIGIVGAHQVVGFPQFAPVLFAQSELRGRRRCGLSAGSGVGCFLAVDAHWPASLSAAGWGRVGGVGGLPGSGWPEFAVRAISAVCCIWAAIWS